MRDPIVNLAVAGEHAGVIDYPRVFPPQVRAVPWLFFLFSLPAAVALFVPFSTPIEGLTRAGADNRIIGVLTSRPRGDVTDWLILLLASAFLIIFPMLAWRLRLLIGRPSPRQVRAASIVSWICLIPAAALPMALVLMAWGSSLFMRDTSLMVVGIVVTGFISLLFSVGLWIARRARRRISPEAGIVARMLTAFLLPAGFVLILLLNHRHAGYYLTLTSESVFIVEMLLLALGQWPPRISRRPNRTSAPHVASAE